MIYREEALAYSKAIEDLVWQLERKPTRRIWEYNRKYQESLAYLDSGDEGELLVGYADSMGIDLTQAARIIIWKFEQYQSVMPALDKARRDAAGIVEGIDSDEAEAKFNSISADVGAVAQVLADPPTA